MKDLQINAEKKNEKFLQNRINQKMKIQTTLILFQLLFSFIHMLLI